MVNILLRFANTVTLSFTLKEKLQSSVAMPAEFTITWNNTGRIIH